MIGLEINVQTPSFQILSHCSNYLLKPCLFKLGRLRDVEGGGLLRRCSGEEGGRSEKPQKCFAKKKRLRMRPATSGAAAAGCSAIRPLPLSWLHDSQSSRFHSWNLRMKVIGIADRGEVRTAGSAASHAASGDSLLYPLVHREALRGPSTGPVLLHHCR